MKRKVNLSALTIQSISIYAVLFVFYIIFMVIPIIGGFIDILLAIGMFVLRIGLMYKAYRGEKFKLPIAADFAEKQTDPTNK